MESNMIFNEIYSLHFKTISKILEKASKSVISKKEIASIIQEMAFDDSNIFLNADTLEELELIENSEGKYRSLLLPQSEPFTMLEKRWLKAIMNDKRIKLFDLKCEGLEDVEPLYRQEDIIYFDQYSDGDDYDNEDYQKNFHMLQEALIEDTDVCIKFESNKGNIYTWKIKPMYFEYSSRNDKFILVGMHGKIKVKIPLRNIILIGELIENLEVEEKEYKQNELVLYVYDKKAALRRVMMYFSYYAKKAKEIDENKYLVKIKYDSDDENDMVATLLSFGPYIEVIKPVSIKNEMCRRLEKQRELFRDNKIERIERY